MCEHRSYVSPCIPVHVSTVIHDYFTILLTHPSDTCRPYSSILTLKLFCICRLQNTLEHLRASSMATVLLYKVARPDRAALHAACWRFGSSTASDDRHPSTRNHAVQLVDMSAPVDDGIPSFSRTQRPVRLRTISHPTRVNTATFGPTSISGPEAPATNQGPDQQDLPQTGADGSRAWQQRRRRALHRQHLAMEQITTGWQQRSGQHAQLDEDQPVAPARVYYVSRVPSGPAGQRYSYTSHSLDQHWHSFTTPDTYSMDHELPPVPEDLDAQHAQEPSQHAIADCRTLHRHVLVPPDHALPPGPHDLATHDPLFTRPAPVQRFTTPRSRVPSPSTSQPHVIAQNSLQRSVVTMTEPASGLEDDPAPPYSPRAETPPAYGSWRDG